VDGTSHTANLSTFPTLTSVRRLLIECVSSVDEDFLFANLIDYVEEFTSQACSN